MSSNPLRSASEASISDSRTLQKLGYQFDKALVQTKNDPLDDPQARFDAINDGADVFEELDLQDHLVEYFSKNNSSTISQNDLYGNLLAKLQINISNNRIQKALEELKPSVAGAKPRYDFADVSRVLFKAFDINEDGQVDWAEYKNVLKAKRR